MIRNLFAAAALLVSTAAMAQDESEPPAGDLRREILWESACSQPDGGGLAFGGQSQSAPDGQPHTRIIENGQWKCIVEQLRKDNPLQAQRDELWGIRDRLKNAISVARHVYFEGRPEAEQEKLSTDALKSVLVVRDQLESVAIYLRKTAGGRDLGRVAIALKRIESASPILRQMESPCMPERLAGLRQAQQLIELAAEALDAEPPPRVCSPIVYDAKSKLYVIFGGDHFDYLTNDTWVFDPAKLRWEQRHPESAPPPRAGHALVAKDGTVTMTGGFNYTSSTKYAGDLHKKGVSTQYANIHDGQWSYDIAANTWTSGTGKKGEPADSRVYRTGAYIPEDFMAGDRPDAAANEKKLAALPTNSWTKVGVPQLLSLNRDWGTAVLDTDRDMILYWSGGHCVHGGSDVPHYHLATNRWELHFPIEMPLGFIGCSGIGIGGRNFNNRPWMTNHTWKSYVYDPGLKKMVVVGRNDQKFDRYTYIYDPDLGDWSDRIPIPETMNSKPANIKVCVTPQGILAWTTDKTELYMLDRKTLRWSAFKFEGELPTPNVDAAGLIYDPKRDRVLFVQKGYSKPFSGQMYALDMKAAKVTALSPGGMNKMSWLTGGGLLREVFYDAASDLFVWGAYVPGMANNEQRQLGYDPTKNEWVGFKIGGSAPMGYSSGMNFDPKRKLVWLVQGQVTAGEVYVLKFDAAKAEAKPVAELNPVAPPPAKE